MFYCIDFDSRGVESKCSSREPLEKYISDNDLELAVAIVGSEEELCLQFSIEEMKDIYGSLCGNPPKFEDENLAAAAVWGALEDNENIFREFTPKLDEKLLKSASDPGQVKPNPPKKPITHRSKGIFKGKIFNTGGKKPRSGRHLALWRFVEDNLGEASFEELVEILAEEPGTPESHIRYALKMNFLVLEDEV